MKNLEYKGYTGSIEYSKEDGLLYGKVLGIRGLISYEGSTGLELEEDFKASIDDYLELCKAKDVKAEKPFKGSFNVRIPSELHREAAIRAAEENMNLNSFVKEAIKGRVITMKQSHYRVHPKTAVRARAAGSGKFVTTKKKKATKK